MGIFGFVLIPDYIANLVTCFKGIHPIETYCTVKANGLKSETMENALKEGEINFITLVRPADPKFVDSRGMFEPQTETMRIRVRQSITADTFRDSISGLFKAAKKAGWKQFNLDVEFQDNRRRTVKLEKDQEAKEILFVRSEQAGFSTALQVCSAEIVPAIVKSAIKVSKGK